ncbi:hypothetical protein HMPREF1869_00722 [Bacteroidales bacterium KA00251]|nr:hypothetical protein HMPREF1869_00722 [Bacteroidales bacterium KA00251]
MTSELKTCTLHETSRFCKLTKRKRQKDPLESCSPKDLFF